jgi:hypothetical protein
VACRQTALAAIKYGYRKSSCCLQLCRPVLSLALSTGTLITMLSSQLGYEKFIDYSHTSFLEVLRFCGCINTATICTSLIPATHNRHTIDCLMLFLAFFPLDYE